MDKSVYDDQDLTADVAGNGIVLASKSKGIAPPPPDTKRMSRNPVKLGAAAVAIGSGLLFWAISQSGVGFKEEKEEAPVQVAAGASPDVKNTKLPPLPEPVESDAAGDNKKPGTPNNGQPAAPSPREQFQEWLEKHHYDRQRARYIAEDQAYTAKLLDDHNGGGRAQPRMPMPAAATGMPGLPAPGTPQAVAAARERVREADESVIQAIVQRELDARRPPREAPLVTPAQPRDDGYLSETVRDPREGHEIAAGTIIPAVLLSAINSDLPGSIVAQVRQPVYSTFHYQQLLIPAGTRILGRYSSQINYGQERVLVAWDELIFPNGRRINLGGMSGTDAQGAAGLRDKVDTHFWRTWGNALLVSLIGVAAQQSQPQNQGAFNTPSASQQAAAAAANSLNETASQVLRKNLNVAPTLEIRPGYLFNILVNKSVSLPPYRED